MSVVLILLSVAFAPTGYAWQRDLKESWEDPREDPFVYFMSIPARCLYSRSSARLIKQQLAARTITHPWHVDLESGHQFNTPLVVLSLAYLWISYLTRTVRLSKFLIKVSGYWLRTAPMKFLQRRYQSIKTRKNPSKYRLRKLYRASLLLILTLAEACYETSNSVLWEVMWLGAALAWGTLRLIGFRLEATVQDEDSWGFGQVLPLMLSLLPVWSFFNTFFDTEKGRASVTALPQENTTYVSPALQKIRRTTWFRFLTIIIITMTTVFATYLVFLLPGSVFLKSRVRNPFGNLGTDAIRSGFGLGVTLQAHVIVTVLCSSICMIFTGICLALHTRSTRSLPSTAVLRHFVKISETWNRHWLRSIGWCLLLLGRLVSQGIFIFVIFLYPGWYFRFLVLE